MERLDVDPRPGLVRAQAKQRERLRADREHAEGRLTGEDLWHRDAHFGFPRELARVDASRICRLS